MTGRAKALPAAGGALLVFLGLLGTLLPVVTAFSLPASLPLLLGAGALLTIYIVTMFSVRRLAWVLLLVLVAAWAFVCLRWQALLRVGAQVTIASVANELALGVNFISEIALPAGASAAEQAAGCTLFSRDARRAGAAAVRLVDRIPVGRGAVRGRVAAVFLR